MTTIDTAAAWHVGKPFALAVMVIVLGLGIAGCETGSNLFTSNSDATLPALAVNSPNGQTSGSAKVAIAPVIGAPDGVAKQLQAQLASEIERKNITVAKTPGGTADYTIRGYIVSAKESAGTKVSYIWDITVPSTDPTKPAAAGKRVNRITGEELLSNPAGTDPWAAVTPKVVSDIAGKTASSFATWLPSQQTAQATGSGIAPAAAPLPKSAASSPPAPAPHTKAALKQPPAGTATTTGSIDKSGKLVAMVPSVIGAPGDGSVSLTGALQRELARKGIALTTAPGSQTYRVEGNVAVGPSKNGKQPIQINWDVKDPAGKKLGTVSQKNEIPQGSLDGAWGKTADAAAAAATQGILKLLPQ